MSSLAPPKTTRRNPQLRLVELPSAATVLQVVHGERFGHRLHIDRRPRCIGRGEDCDFRIDDLAASRRHCEVWRNQGGCWVRDLGATNTTCVNERSIVVSPLQAGDHLMVGGTVFRLMS